MNILEDPLVAPQYNGIIQNVICIISKMLLRDMQLNASAKQIKTAYVFI